MYYSSNSESTAIESRREEGGPRAVQGTRQVGVVHHDAQTVRHHDGYEDRQLTSRVVPVLGEAVVLQKMRYGVWRNLLKH